MFMLGMGITFIWWALFGGLCGYIAQEKGRNVLGWFAIGCLLGIFAVIAVCAVPKLEGEG